MGNQYVALNIKDSDRNTASIVVKGGEFYKFNPANNAAEGEGTNFLADQPSATKKYISEKSGDWYVVKLINLWHSLPRKWFDNFLPIEELLHFQGRQLRGMENNAPRLNQKLFLNNDFSLSMISEQEAGCNKIAEWLGMGSYRCYQSFQSI